MEILVSNFDLAKDPHSRMHFSVDGFERTIKKYNHGGSRRMIIYDPYGDCVSDYEGIDYIFNLYRSEKTEGIMSIGVTEEEPPGIIYQGHPGIGIVEDIAINPKYLPILTIATLTAYMPHIPWDEFGDHIRLNGEDAENLMMLWKSFLHQKGAYFKAINNGYYPTDTERSLLGFIFILDEKNLNHE